MSCTYKLGRSVGAQNTGQLCSRLHYYILACDNQVMSLENSGGFDKRASSECYLHHRKYQIPWQVLEYHDS